LDVTASRRPPARERILEVADRLFYELGIHAVGVDLIVTESGAAKTTLYSHFRSKDDLVAAYLQRRCEQWRERLAVAVSKADPGSHDRILGVFDVLADWFAEPDFRGCPFINAMAEFTVDHPAARVTAEHRTGLRTLLRQLCDEAEVTAPDVTADRLMLLYDAAIITAHLDHNTAAAHTARDAAATLLKVS
jgi:AcrR family transcriptional regulator